VGRRSRQFLAAAAAAPVYTLLGKKDRHDEFSAIETGLMDGDIAFRSTAAVTRMRPTGRCSCPGRKNNLNHQPVKK